MLTVFHFWVWDQAWISRYFSFWLVKQQVHNIKDFPSVTVRSSCDHLSSWTCMLGFSCPKSKTKSSQPCWNQPSCELQCTEKAVSSTFFACSSESNWKVNMPTLWTLASWCPAHTHSHSLQELTSWDLSVEVNNGIFSLVSIFFFFKYFV